MWNSIGRQFDGGWLFAVLVSLPSVALAQVSAANGEITKTELRFPARGLYRNPNRVVQQYDPIADRTRVAVGIASGNPLSIILKPIVLLSFEAMYTGTAPNAAPDSILMTSRIFRLAVNRQQPGTMAPTAVAQPQAMAVAAGTPGPMLTFLIAPSMDPSAGGSTAWRTSVASVMTGSNQLVGADDTGIWFHGRPWLAAIANVIDMTRKKGESPLTLVTLTDTGRFALERLPERVRKLLREGLRLAIIEDVHRSAIPVGALAQVTSASNRVTSRLGTLDFAIEGDELNALQDFASRLGPRERAVAIAPDTTALTAEIPVGTNIELKSGSRECVDSVKLGDQFTAIITRPVGSGERARLDAGAPVVLMVSDLERRPDVAEAVPMQMSAVSVRLSDRQYALHGTVVKSATVRQGTHDCVPMNGLLVLRLSSAFRTAP